MTIKRVIFLLIYAVILSYSYTGLTGAGLPWYSSIPLGILGFYLSKAIFPDKKSEEQEKRKKLWMK